MDKEKTCPKSKNATLSLSNVFMWAGKSGNKPWEKQWKVGEAGVYVPTKWYMNNIISAQTVLLPMS